MALPWAEVNSIDSKTIIEYLELEATRERNKYNCPSCDSPDGLHDYGDDRGFFCWSCRTGFSNVDLVAAASGLQPFEACIAVARQFLGYIEDGNNSIVPTRAPRKRQKPAPKPTPQEEALNKIQRRRGARLPTDIYADILTKTRLGPEGQAFLDGRGIDPHEADAYGFRSIPGEDGWNELEAYLRSEYSEGELTAACFPELSPADLKRRRLPIGTKKLKMLWGGYLPYLIIPYWQNGEVVTLRFGYLGEDRDDDDAASPKYLSLAGSGRPPIPFNADDIGSRYLHATEGELNGFVLRLPPYRQQVISTGAATYWKPEWTDDLLKSHRIIAWFDTDTAGNAAFNRLHSQIAKARSKDFADRFIHRVTDRPVKIGEDGKPKIDREGNPIAMDPNELHEKDLLGPIIAEAPWIERAL